MCFIYIYAIISYSCNLSQWQWLFCYILQAGRTCCQMEGHRKSTGVHWRRDGQHPKSSTPDAAGSEQLARRNADSVVGVGPWRWEWQYRFRHKKGPSCGTLEGQSRTTSSSVSVNNISVLFIIYLCLINFMHTDFTISYTSIYYISIVYFVPLIHVSILCIQT